MANTSKILTFSVLYPEDLEGSLVAELEQASRHWQAVAATGGDIADGEVILLLCSLAAILQTWGALLDQAERNKEGISLPIRYRTAVKP